MHNRTQYHPVMSSVLISRSGLELNHGDVAMLLQNS